MTRRATPDETADHERDLLKHERHDKFILDEHLNMNTVPIFLPNGRPVSVSLSQYLRKIEQ